MNEQFLNLKQNTCAARIFLNTFGLTLEELNDVDQFSKIKIFDKDMNVVGELHFDNGKVVMMANYNDSSLSASFEIAKMSGFVDYESDGALFGQWSSKINFEVKTVNNTNISGEFLLTCSADSEYGLTCRCHPLIKCEIEDEKKTNAILRMQRDGAMFALDIASGKYYEDIDIRPWDEMNGFLRHVITDGEYDKEHYKHEYRKYMGVFSAGEKERDKLHVFLSETQWDDERSFLNEFPLKLGDDNSDELVIQKGMLMSQIDSDMFDRIRELRELLYIGDVSLLDNLVGICYDTQTDAKIKALLGLSRQKMNYQNGGDNLVNSYFGIGINNKFFPESVYKRLLKKNN